MEYSSLKKIRFSTMQLLAIGFIATIFLGGILLALPVCNVQPIRFIDALFTSTSAVCVTGLVTVVPAAQFTALGKIILLILIQIGGLGVIACVTGFFIILKRKITVRERVIIQESYNLTTLSGMVAFVLKIIKYTFVMEGMGAVFFAFVFVPEFGVIQGAAYSIFHSVSAFCNAGIDILGDGSFMQYVRNPIINLTTMVLIVSGGIGFTVWDDLIGNFKKVREKKLVWGKFFARLSLHSKLAITMSLLLIVVGTMAIFALEYNNAKTIGNLAVKDKIMASAFHSVSTRTAGFATVSQDGLTAGSKFLSCILMFIGGSPAGTAGGIKTTTAAMLVLTCITVVYGKRDTECFGRKIPVENFRTGFAVVMLAFLFLTAGVTMLTIFEPGKDFLGLLYEAVSAIATVGLSANLTPSLGIASKIVVMILMYAGRIGPVTVALVFGGKRNPGEFVRELPEKRIMVG